MKRAVLVSLAAALGAFAYPLLATSPALWIGGHANCPAIARDTEIGKIRGPLTRKEARRAAIQIVDSCKSSIPTSLFTAQELADMRGADRFEIAKALRLASLKVRQ